MKIFEFPILIFIVNCEEESCPAGFKESENGCDLIEKEGRYKSP